MPVGVSTVAELLCEIEEEEEFVFNHYKGVPKRHVGVGPRRHPSGSTPLCLR